MLGLFPKGLVMATCACTAHRAGSTQPTRFLQQVGIHRGFTEPFKETGTVANTILDNINVGHCTHCIEFMNASNFVCQGAVAASMGSC